MSSHVTHATQRTQQRRWPYASDGGVHARTRPNGEDHGRGGHSGRYGRYKGVHCALVLLRSRSASHRGDVDCQKGVCGCKFRAFWLMLLSPLSIHLHPPKPCVHSSVMSASFCMHTLCMHTLSIHRQQTGKAKVHSMSRAAEAAIVLYICC